MNLSHPSFPFNFFFSSFYLFLCIFFLNHILYNQEKKKTKQNKTLYTIPFHISCVVLNSNNMGKNIYKYKSLPTRDKKRCKKQEVKYYNKHRSLFFSNLA